jgi:hypothetical protein
VTSFVRIGGLTLAVHGSEVPLENPHAHFAVAASPADADMFVTYDQSYAPPRGRMLFDSGSVWKLFDDPEGFRIECSSTLVSEHPYKIATVSRDLRRVDLQMRVRGLQPIHFPLDEVLVNALLTRRRGVELHACGVIDRGNGLLFIGNSGDGKTTTARLWEREKVEIVSDDRVVVRSGDGGWTMYGTPWHGEADICSAAYAPLRRIFVLDKAPRNAVAPLRPAEAVARLFACAFPPFHDPQGLETVVDTLGELALSVPVAKLSFVNDSSAVAFVRQQTAPPARGADHQVRAEA